MDTFTKEKDDPCESISRNSAVSRRKQAEKIKREREQSRDLGAEEIEKEIDRLKAKLIVRQIPSRAKTEARLGRSFALLMSLKESDYVRPPESRADVCKPEWLKGAAALVWAECERAKINPSIQYWYADEGLRGGFNIVFHWK